MRLKKIEVVGFKSFADRQVVVVDDHVTGVIGPNGCGKSNIVDAVRWAMGEQSAKHLRGSGMADVIFAGCTTRGPGAMAEVTLTFENEGDAPAYVDQPLIAITRRLYADGTSEYLINKVPSRLRDITELLMGTGAGTKGYSIIEQGQVGRIVNSKPEERRHIIDEAAGITRFKAQKAAAQRKIEATRQNLLRTSDVITELEGRLSTLRRQAQKAERYKRYRSELRDLDLWMSSHKFLELSSTGAVLTACRDALAIQIEDVRTALTAREAQLESRRTELVEVEGALTERQQTVYDLDNRVRLLEAENEYRRREREGLVQSGTAAEAEAEAVGRGVASVAAELEDIDAQRKALGHVDEPSSEHGSVGSLEGAYADAERSLAEARGRLESARVELSERTSALAGAEARRGSHREAATGAQERLAEVRRAHDELVGSVDTAAAQATSAELAVGEAAATLGRLTEQRAELDRRRSELRRHVAAAEVELDTKRAEVHRHRSRLQSLEEIQDRYRGCHSGVQLVMEHRAELTPTQHADGQTSEGSAEATPVVHGILADYVTAPEHLEHAVSAVLGERLEGVVVDGPDVGARGVELLKREQEGRTAFVPRHARAPRASETATAEATSQAVGGVTSDGVPIGWEAPSTEAPRSPFEVIDLSIPGVDDLMVGGLPSPGASMRALTEQPGVLGRLADLVDVTGDLGALGRSLLGDAVVVESLDRALELWQRSAPEATLVSLDGDRVEPSGVVIGGAPTALNAALLQQKREIRELGEILESLDESFETARGRHLALAQELAEVEAAREQSEVDVLAAEKTKVGAEAETSNAQTEVARLQGSVGELDAQAETIQEELAARELEVEQLAEAVETGKARIAELEGTASAAEAEIGAVETERDRLASELTEAKVALARWQQQTDALKGARERLTRQAEAERQRMRRLEETALASKKRVAEIDEASAAAGTERDGLVEQSKTSTALVHETRERFDSLRLQIDELDASMRTLRGDLDERRERTGEVELGLQEIQLERAHLVRDVQDRFDIEVTEVLIDFHDRAQTTKLERDRHKELKRILSRMGEVNLTAIDEFEDVSKRFEYLTTQRDDRLENAITQLQEAIDKINKTTRELFRETFEAVNERFTQLFPRLFGGGHAQLKLTDPSDLLLTGVEIEARPPGKQPRTLDLLSGGEKALTAVSLIFAIFLIKPSPFCLLDEVDAPLDDANVARFSALVRELAGNTQFVIITHNKVTMEQADRLYGVTMEQRGVSKLVSVNLRRAVELAYN